MSNNDCIHINKVTKSWSLNAHPLLDNIKYLLCAFAHISLKNFKKLGDPLETFSHMCTMTHIKDIHCSVN